MIVVSVVLSATSSAVSLTVGVVDCAFDGTDGGVEGQHCEET